MAEAVFITPTVGIIPATPGASLAPAAAEGIFAGMLAQRLKPSVEGVAVGAVKPLPPGQSSPQDGNVLPPQGLAPAVLDAEAETLVPGLPLPLMVELLPGAENDGMPLPTAPPDALTQNLPVVRAATDDPPPLPVAVIPPLAALLDAKPQPPPDDRPVPADGRRTSLSQVPSPAALQLASLSGAQSTAVLDSRPQPASLGLGASGETAEMLRGSSITSLSAEQTVRGSMAARLTSQTLAGDALSRQFQQQIDRLLATSRAPTSAGMSTPILAATDTTASVTPPDSLASAFLPSITGDVRGSALTSPISLPALPVNTTVGHPGWSAELGQRMMWLANQEIREAQIQLNPRHLGPIDVRIVYSDAQQLSVSFHAQNPAAREALDAALPRLREMFEQQGLNLADASVSQESFAGQQRDAENDNGLPRHAATDDSHWTDSDGDESRQRSPPVAIGQGLVDTFV